MIDISHKSNTYREAMASALLKVSKTETIEAIKNNSVPKGNVLEAARTAGLLGVKQTANLIPDCHPLPIEQTSITYDIREKEVLIQMKVSTVYKTGVEVEAMHGVSIVALTMYDMLKPIDKGIEISTIKLENKRGGKSDYKDEFKKPIRSAVIVCSDTISNGQKEDKAGKAILEKLKKWNVENQLYAVIPDEKEEIQKKALELSEGQIDLIIFTGGTGLSVRDVTPESLEPLIDRRIPGIEETIRDYGQNRMPYSMLSRSLVGVRGKSLVMALPGSTKGASESMDAVFPHVLHVFKIISGAKH